MRKVLVLAALLITGGVRAELIIEAVPTKATKETTSSAVEVNAGSGVVVGQKGKWCYILTAEHVIEGDDEPCVTAAGVRECAEVVAQDKDKDLAVIRIKAKLPITAVIPTPSKGPFTALSIGFDEPFRSFTTKVWSEDGRLVSQKKGAPGRSGGPYISGGYVVGIHQGSDSENGRGADSATIHRFLKENDLSFLIGGKK
jgi:S1-C subfamily serine protease